MNISAQLPDKPDQGMLQKKGGRGFPHCIFMDENGEVLIEARPSDEDSFKSASRPITLLFAMRKEASTAKRGAKKTAEQNLSLIEAVVNPKPEEFKKLNKLAKKKKLDKEIRALYQMTVKTWPAREAMEKANAAIAKATSRDEYNAAGKKRDESMYELFKKKFRIEKEDMPYFDDFWMGVAQHAVVASDKKNGLAAIEKLEKKYKGNQRYMNYFRGIRTKLEAL